MYIEASIEVEINLESFNTVGWKVLITAASRSSGVLQKKKKLEKAIEWHL